MLMVTTEDENAEDAAPGKKGFFDRSLSQIVKAKYVRRGHLDRLDLCGVLSLMSRVTGRQDGIRQLRR